FLLDVTLSFSMLSTFSLHDALPILVFCICQSICSEEDLSEQDLPESCTGGKRGTLHLHNLAAFLSPVLHHFPRLPEKAIRRPGFTLFKGNVSVDKNLTDRPHPFLIEAYGPGRRQIMIGCALVTKGLNGD